MFIKVGTIHKNVPKCINLFITRGGIIILGMYSREDLRKTKEDINELMRVNSDNE